jgi:bacterial/archaeal transporter family-2 protein
LLTTILPALFALICGAVLTTQVGGNTLLGKSIGNSYIPAAVNMVTGLVFTVLLLLIVHKPMPSVAQLRAAPWWTWLAGGFLGTAYLTGNILLAPKLGAAALVGLVVTGQLLFAVLADNYGWLGFEPHPATLWRGVGCVLMMGGVFLIAKY